MLPPALRRAAALLLLALVPVPAAHAGEGAIQDGKLDLLVYFAYDEPDVTDWEPVFVEYSKRLKNATEGGLQLGTVSFTKCEELKDRADVWVLNDFSGARAHLRGLGVPGRHMTISQIHKNSTNPILGQFGLVHETGHYVWGVYDEYKGFIGNAPAVDANHYCVDVAGDVGCVMDGGTTIVPNNMRREFCTRGGIDFPVTGHFRGVTNGMGQAVRNDQEFYLGRSCWEQIELSGAGGLRHPTTELDTSFPLHEAVTFDTSRLNGTLAVALVLDKSGSMSAEEKMEQMILGAQLVVGLLQDGDSLTVVAFDDTPQVLLPASVVNDAVKDIARASIAELEADGGTAVGDGVLTAVDQLDTVFGCKEVLIVISDGVSLTPAADATSVLNAVASQNAIAYGIALGAYPDDASLAALSAGTGGTFFKSPTADQLSGVLDSVIAFAGGGIPITEETSIVPALGTAVQRFNVSTFASEVRVSLAHAPGAHLDLELTDPLGQTFSLDRLPATGSSYASDVQQTLTVPDPEAGAWTANISEMGGADVVYDFLAYLGAATLDVTAVSPSERIGWPSAMPIEVQVVAGVPVGGARVTGTVLRPDGSTVAAAFFDDGADIHGDEKADDGVYSTLFTEVTRSGAYRFDIEVIGLNAVAASNQECGAYGFGEDGQSFEPVEPFTASRTHTVLIEGVPNTIDDGRVEVDTHAAVTNGADVVAFESAPTAVAGFELTVGPEQSVFLDSVTFDVATEDDDLPLVGLAVHRDENADGLVDRPSIPVAGAALSPSGELVFTRGSVFSGGTDPIALLEAGTTTHFLITAGEALASVAEASSSAKDVDEAAGGTLRFLFQGPPSSTLLGAAIAALLIALATRIRRRARWAALAGAVAVAGLGCHEGSESTVGGVSVPASYELTLEPSAVALTGAATGTDVTRSGNTVRFSFDLD